MLRGPRSRTAASRAGRFDITSPAQSAIRTVHGSDTPVSNVNTQSASQSSQAAARRRDGTNSIRPQERATERRVTRVDG